MTRDEFLKQQPDEDHNSMAQKLKRAQLRIMALTKENQELKSELKTLDKKYCDALRKAGTYKKKLEENSFKDIKSERKPRICYDVGCIYHIGIDSCMLSFPPGTSFEKMITCPYRMPKPLPNVDFGETSK